MYRSRVKVERVAEQLDPDPTRVIPRFFGPGDDKRLRGIIERIRVLDRSSDTRRELRDFCVIQSCIVVHCGAD